VGTQTFVYGYIESAAGRDDHNSRIIENFTFDTVYPFRKVFGKPSRAYQNSIIGFADSMKATEGEWGEWLSRFEVFLGKLDAVSAKVHFEDSDSCTRNCYAYLVTDGKWRRWKLRVDEIEEEDRAVT